MSVKIWLLPASGAPIRFYDCALGVIKFTVKSQQMEINKGQQPGKQLEGIMREIRFTDTTFRDGHASLWAQGMRTGMMLALARDMDKAGFAAAEVIANSNFKKCVRELREDPWERIRLLAKSLTHTPLAAMAGAGAPAPFGIAPLALQKLYLERLTANGIRRLNVMESSNNMTGRLVSTVPIAKNLGLQVVVALVFSLSPKHTDDYYAQKAKEAVALGADKVYLKDSGGLLTPERVNTVVPAILQNLNGTPLEFHTHCTTGLGPVSTLAAVLAGVDTVHTAVPPLANGASQPSVFNVAGNLRALGFTPLVDEVPLERVSNDLMRMAREDGFPVGHPLEYDYGQYVHQVPGGVISNLRHQLRQMNIEHRLPEVLEESVRVRQDLGYPIMVTPFSQFVVSQATINVLSGERYKLVTDEVIKYALGVYGDEASSGVTPETREIILDRPRAGDLTKTEQAEPSLKEIRDSFGGGITDEELLLRYAVGGEADVDAMKESGPFRDYSQHHGRPIVGLVETVLKSRDLRHVSIQQPGLSLIVE
ncbi:MAG: biotin carboxyl carrier protein [Actinomycetota bacterium]|nr:MAG: biotin carboxyl carrier protein [Actinomycetota bacterium]